MTKKDYVLIASILLHANERAKESKDPRALIHFVACQFADKLEKDNPAFDRARFLRACGV